MYTEKFMIGYNDADCFGRIRMPILFADLAAVATKDAYKTGIMNDEFMKRFGWIVTRQTLHLNDSIRLGDEIAITTEMKKFGAAIFPRYYRIERNGKTIGECFSLWTILDLKARRVARASATGIDFPETNEKMSEMPKRLKSIEGEKETSYDVQFSDIDLNGHMNNTCYIRLAYNLLDHDYLKSHRLVSLSINYEKEVAPESVIDLYLEREGDTYLIEGRQERSCFLTELSFAEESHD